QLDVFDSQTIEHIDGFAERELAKRPGLNGELPAERVEGLLVHLNLVNRGRFPGRAVLRVQRERQCQGRDDDDQQHVNAHATAPAKWPAFATAKAREALMIATAAWRSR